MTESTEDSLTGTPSGYLRYLPACFADADGVTGLPFAALYLKIFEKLYSGIADGDDLEKADKTLDPTVAYRAGIRELLDANVIGNLFYPRWSFLFPSDDTAFMPPLSGETVAKDKTALFAELANYFGLQGYTDEEKSPSEAELWARAFLEWLGSTIGFSVDKNWSIDDSRTLIAKMFPLDRARGTQMGMKWLLDACMSAYPLPVAGVSQTSTAVDDCARPAFIVRETDTNEFPAFHVYDVYPNTEAEVVISDDVRPAFVHDGTKVTVDDNKCVAHVPWRFEVAAELSAGASVSGDDEQKAVRAYYGAMRAVLESARPALTSYVVQVVVNGGDSKNSYRLQGRRVMAMRPLSDEIPQVSGR